MKDENPAEAYCNICDTCGIEVTIVSYTDKLCRCMECSLKTLGNALSNLKEKIDVVQ